MQDEMWAVQYGSYGGPEVLMIGSTPKPKVGRSEVLVEVAGFSLNNVDVEKRLGNMKGVNGFGFPKGIGVDFAGVVADTGAGANQWQVGDRVWGYLGIKPCGKSGAAAQYVVAHTNKITHAPTNIPIEEAAALPLAGLTALQALRDTLKVKPGQRTLIVGGTGGVGSTAIQVATALGAEVDAVVGSQASVATKAGANRIFDYHSVTPDDIAERYDTILDTAPKHTNNYRQLLRKGGRIAVLSPAALPAIIRSLFTSGPIIRMVSGKPSTTDLDWLKSRVESGEITPIIDECYGLERVLDAHRDFEEKPAAGKRIISVAGCDYK